MPDDDKSKNGDGGGEGGAPEPPPKKPTPWWVFMLAAIVVVGFIAVVLYIVFAPRPDVWTDDAYVRVHYANIAPRVSGRVIAVSVDDNQVVREGQTLVALDPRDFETNVAAAEASLARDTALVRQNEADLARQPALIAEQDAQLASARAHLDFTLRDRRRYSDLAATGAGTEQQHQQATAAERQDRAQVANAAAAVEAARKQTDVLRAQRDSALGTVRTDEAQLAQARLNQSYTMIEAPIAGMVGQRSVQVGDWVTPGSTLMALVPLERIYIEANYRELALRHVRPGQRVSIHVDAYDVMLDGVVDSVPPASGAEFSPIPPANATGNFTKIVQRLPVKITLLPNQPLARLLRIGFSVETTIHTGLEDVVGEQRRSDARVVSP